MDYDEAVNIISKVEAGSGEHGSITIDVNSLMSHGINLVKYDYQKANAVINSIDWVKTDTQTAAQPAQIQTTQQKSSTEQKVLPQQKTGLLKGISGKISNVEDTLKKQIEKEKQVVQPVAKAPQKPKQPDTSTKPKPMKEVDSAASEIRSILGGMGKSIEGSMSKEKHKISASSMVLPTLSLQDQISELEKMSLGLEGNVFNKEQLAIIRDEVENLSDLIKFEKQPLDSFQKSLTSLRNQRLKEVESRLDQ